jgi:hypothetical protein
MSKVKIESGVPIPPRESGGKWRMLIWGMNVGDSFLVPTNGERCAVISAAIQLSISVTTRKVNGEGYRIWRLK